MRKIDEIIVHCSDTPAGREVSVSEIDRWHKARGMKCVGYHWVIGLDGRVESGRNEADPGAHCVGHNGRSVGVCYIGGRDANGRYADTRTVAQRRALLRLIGELRERYPGARVYGHRDFAARVCPCFDARTEYG